MRRRHAIASVAVVAALGGGTAGAVAIAGKADTEQAVLDDAAKELGVTSEELRSALADAEDAQLDQAVEDGRLTQEQADEIREHRGESGSVLGMGRGGPRGHRGPDGFGGPMGRRGDGPREDLAAALGIDETELHEQLENGKTVKEIATAQGKTLDQVRAAVKAAVIKRLDADVKAGRLTAAQRDDIAEHLDERLEHLGERPEFRGGQGPPPGRP